MNISEVTLLSKEEYINYKRFIPEVDLWWWLQTPCDETYVYVVFAGMDISAYNAGYTCGAVRPVLKISNLNMQPGERFELVDYTWTVISPDTAICNKCVGFSPYQKQAHDLSNYENSDIRVWLDNWTKLNDIRINQQAQPSFEEVYDTLLEMLTTA